ncbi:MAG: hypothetical protein HC930_04150 [Hydrococcus sp. SU_1_0]|nr:hypothetical protein [Hydrococcus sp. SU_1_0]
MVADPLRNNSKNVNHAAIKYLLDIEVLERTGYSDKQKQCREYRIKLPIVENILNITPPKVESYKEVLICDLFTGEIIKKKQQTKIMKFIIKEIKKRILVTLFGKVLNR